MSGLPPLRSQFKSTMTLSAAQRARIEANRKAAQERRIALYTARRLAPGMVRTTLSYRRSMPYSGETHYNDCNFQTTPPAAGALMTFTCVSPFAASPLNPNGTSLNLISQGTTQHQRIGNKVCLHAIRMNGTLVLNNNTFVSDAYIRVLLVRDKQCNGAAATVADVLEPTGAGVTNVYAFANMDNLDRFEIIKDKRIRTDGSGFGTVGTANAVTHVPFKMSHKIRSRDKGEIMFSATTGAITEVRSNNYFVILMSSVDNVTTLEGRSRVYWRE